MSRSVRNKPNQLLRALNSRQRTVCLNGFDIKITLKSIAIEIIFKSWGSFGIYQLISTADSAQFHSKSTGLAVLIKYSRVHFSSDTAFLKILKKPSIVQKK